MSAPPRAGLCFHFMCWEARTGDHTLEYVLCFHCQHSLFFGCDVTKQPRKKMRPSRRKSDSDDALDPVALPCELCEANGWEPVYEADEMGRRRRDREADVRWARKSMTVVGARLVMERRGVSCIPLETAPPAKKSITTSRSFPVAVAGYEELKE